MGKWLRDICLGHILQSWHFPRRNWCFIISLLKEFWFLIKIANNSANVVISLTYISEAYKYFSGLSSIIPISKTHDNCDLFSESVASSRRLETNWEFVMLLFMTFRKISEMQCIRWFWLEQDFHKTLYYFSDD